MCRRLRRSRNGDRLWPRRIALQRCPPRAAAAHVLVSPPSPSAIQLQPVHPVSIWSLSLLFASVLVMRHGPAVCASLTSIACSAGDACPAVCRLSPQPPPTPLLYRMNRRVPRNRSCRDLAIDARLRVIRAMTFAWRGSAPSDCQPR